MGYRLFLADKQKSSGNLDVEFKIFKLKLGQAAPGTFFSVCGAVIIFATIYRGLDYSRTKDTPSPETAGTLPKEPPFAKAVPKQASK
jgi:hypothetical protein